MTILNQPDPPALADIPEADEDLNINMGAITVGEVKEAIRKLKNEKPPGEDGVCPEMLKAEDQETPCILQSILQDIWENETPPDDWNTGVIIKLPKKGNLGDCNNWRGITLLSLTSKIFSQGHAVLYCFKRSLNTCEDKVMQSAVTGEQCIRKTILSTFRLPQTPDDCLMDRKSCQEMHTEKTLPCECELCMCCTTCMTRCECTHKLCSLQDRLKFSAK